MLYFRAQNKNENKLLRLGLREPWRNLRTRNTCSKPCSAPSWLTAAGSSSLCPPHPLRLSTSQRRLTAGIMSTGVLTARGEWEEARNTVGAREARERESEEPRPARRRMCPSRLEGTPGRVWRSNILIYIYMAYNISQDVGSPTLAHTPTHSLSLRAVYLSRPPRHARTYTHTCINL